MLRVAKSRLDCEGPHWAALGRILRLLRPGAKIPLGCPTSDVSARSHTEDRLDQPPVLGVEGEGDAAVHPELLVDMVEVQLDRALVHVELRGDLLVSEASATMRTISISRGVRRRATSRAPASRRRSLSSASRTDRISSQSPQACTVRTH